MSPTNSDQTVLQPFLLNAVYLQVYHHSTRGTDMFSSPLQDNGTSPGVGELKDRIRRLLCAARPSVSLSCRPAQLPGLKVSPATSEPPGQV